MNSLRQSLMVLLRSRSPAALPTSTATASLHLRRNLSFSATSIPLHNQSQSTSLLAQKGDLKLQNRFSSGADSNVKERFDKLVKNNKVVVFMKGVPDEPRCGFSNAVVQILRMHGVTGYDSHDVLADESIRQGIKDYTNWPTIPQVFIDGEFVGGCDILIEMHKNGELVEQLSKVGIKSALLDQDGNKTKDG